MNKKTLRPYIFALSTIVSSITIAYAIHEVQKEAHADRTASEACENRVNSLLSKLHNAQEQFCTLCKSDTSKLPKAPAALPESIQSCQQKVENITPLLLQLTYTFDFIENGTTTQGTIKKNLNLDQVAPFGSVRIEWIGNTAFIHMFEDAWILPISFQNHQACSQAKECVSDIQSIIKELYSIAYNKLYGSDYSESSLNPEKAQELRKYLHTNFSSSNDFSISRIARDHNISGIIYPTSDIGLLHILKTKVNLPSKCDKQDITSNTEFSYLSYVKMQSSSYEDVLRYSGNRLPVIIFPTESLDAQQFYTTTEKNSDSFTPYSVQGKILQSAESIDSSTLFTFFDAIQSSPHNTIVLKKPIPFPDIEAILVKRGTKDELLNKLNKEQIFPPQGKNWKDLLIEVDTLDNSYSKREYFKSTWLEPENATSNEVLRWNFLHEEFNPEHIITLYCREYKHIKLLFNANLSPQDRRSVRDVSIALANAFTQQMPHYNQLDNNLKKIAQYALLFQEITKPIRTEDEFAYGQSTILLDALNKLGLEKHQMLLGQYLRENEVLHKALTNSFDLTNSLNALQEHARNAKVPLREYFTLAYCVFCCQKAHDLTTQPGLIRYDASGKALINHPYIEALKEAVDKEHQARDEINAQNTSQDELGLFSLYIWEKIDTRHRHGLSLAKERFKYEMEFLQKPYWQWRGKFWEWLDSKGRGKKIPSLHYYTEEEKKNLLLHIENGKVKFHESENVQSRNRRIFVVDLDKNIYTSIKSEGDRQTCGIAHSSLSNANSVFVSGRMTIRSDGKIRFISNESGHYRAAEDEIAFFLHLLEERGVNLKGVKLKLVAGLSKNSKKNFYDAYTWLREYEKGLIQKN